MTRKPDPAKLPSGVYPSGKAHYQYRLPLPRDPDTGKRRQEVRGGFQSPDDAYLARAQRLAQLGRGAVPDQRRLLGDYLAGYLDAHDADAATLWNYRGVAKRHILPAFGQVLLRDLAVDMVRAWVARLHRERGPSAAWEARRVLVQVLNQAVADQVLERNVAALVRPPRYKPKPRTILSEPDILRFLTAASDDPHAALWYLALLAQLRPGELAGLRWRDLDLERAELAVVNTRTRNARGQWIVGDGAKTDASARRIALPSLCVDLLREHRRRQVAHRLALPPGYWDDHDLVFPNRQGNVLNNSTMERRLEKLCAVAGVPRVTPHELRHSGATWARALGEDAEVVSRRLGHASVRFTLDHYSHARPGEQQRAAERLEQAIQAARRQARESS